MLLASMMVPDFAVWRKPELMEKAQELGVKTRFERTTSNGKKHRTWRPSADVAVDCALEWQKRADQDAVRNTGSASSSVDPGGNHTGEEGSTVPIQEPCPLIPVPASIARLSTTDLRKRCHEAGIATKTYSQSPAGKKQRVHVVKDLLQQRLAAKVSCASGSQDTQVDPSSLHIKELRKECQRVGIAISHSQHTRDGQKRHVCLQKKDLVRQLAAHDVVRKKPTLQYVSGSRAKATGSQTPLASRPLPPLFPDL